MVVVMMAGEGALEAGSGPVETEGLGMIIMVDMNVRWGVGPSLPMKGLMVGTLDALVAIKVDHLIGILVVVVIMMLPAQGLRKEKA